MSEPTTETTETFTPRSAVDWLQEAARYFERRPTGGEDMAHWSNVYNADNCRQIAALIKRLDAREKEAVSGK